MKAVELKEIVRAKMEKAINEAFEELEELETKYGYKEVSPKLVVELENKAETLSDEISDEIYSTISYLMHE